MRIFFLGDIVGRSGRLSIVKNLKNILEKKKIIKILNFHSQKFLKK